MVTESEAEAVAERYRRREVGDLYSPLRPEVMLSTQERQRRLISLLREHAPRRLEDMRLLELGCGFGTNLLEFLQLGFDPTHLFGNELLPDRAERARRTLPESATIIQSDAVDLAFPPSSFDLVYVSLVFSSLLTDDFQVQLANKMWSWVKPGGAVLWYDFIYSNPSNPDVRGVPIGRVRGLFPDAEITVKRTTLAPPISRVACKVHHLAYPLLNLIPLLRTHVLCWIHKRDTSGHV